MGRLVVNDAHTLSNRSDMLNLEFKVPTNFVKRGMLFMCVPLTLREG